MIDSCLLPDFYVHPDYLLVDQVLDQIGKNIIDDWDSSFIKASKILHQSKKEYPNNFKRLITGIEIAYLTPQQEAAMRYILSASESSSKNYISSFFPFSDFLRKGHIGRMDIAPISAEKFNKIIYEQQLKRQELEGNKIPHLLKEKNNRESIGNTEVFCNAAFLLKDIKDLPEDKLSEEASRFEITFGIIDFSVNDFDHEGERNNLKKLLNLTKARNSLRDALVKGTLCSYIGKDRQYHSIPSNVWGDEQEWLRLLMEGFKASIVWTDGDDPPYVPERIIISEGRVLFRKSEVKAFLENTLQALPCSDSQKDKESWQKLFSPQKPYLKLLNELALSLPEETIETKFKKELVDIIEKKARSLGLDVSGRKLEHLATFLRSPEQEKGTAYRSKNKRQTIA